MEFPPPPPKPAVFSENHLIDAILEGQYPIGSHLPAERELATQLGVTRPTLREALQRMARDGWIEICHGKSTRVRNYWQEGNLGVLSAIARRSSNLPPDFVSNLLVVRQSLAPAYTRLAVELAPDKVIETLEDYPLLADTPEAYTSFDWNIHHQLAITSRNPVFTLILNGFYSLYQQMGCIYFAAESARQHSSQFYRALSEAAASHDAPKAGEIANQVMHESLELWRNRAQNGETYEAMERMG